MKSKMKGTTGRMKKVGIITLPGRYNYGNRLQNYAVSQIYRSIGMDAETLLPMRRINVEKSIKSFVYKLATGKREIDTESLLSRERLGAFDRFNLGIPMKGGVRPGARLADEFDFFSVGSDQVWNPNYNRYNEDWYYLTFARREQRIALAPSVGVGALTRKQERRFYRGLRGFDKLSVREASAASLIEGRFGLDAEVICDPTLVLGRDDWSSVANDALTPDGPYVFAYILGNKSAEVDAALTEATQDGVIPVVWLSDCEKYNEPPAGPAEFISLVQSASHVVTDSFHATVFSCIFQTPLTIVHRQGGASMFARLETLSQMLGIEDKVFGSVGFDFKNAGTYIAVSDSIDRERQKFISYLKGCVGE